MDTLLHDSHLWLVTNLFVLFTLFLIKYRHRNYIVADQCSSEFLTTTMISLQINYIFALEGYYIDGPKRCTHPGFCLVLGYLIVNKCQVRD